MKKKLLLSSILSIVMCFSLICGATFALFTSEDKVNISATSGKVIVRANIDNDSVVMTSRDEVRTDGYFANGGNAVWTEDSVQLNLITPGDKIEFNINVTNESNVTAKYRTIVRCVDGLELFAGLRVSIDYTNDNKEAQIFDGLTAYGAWTEISAVMQETSIDVVKVVVEFPYLTTSQNEYQDLSTKLSFSIEAVQGNADVVDNTAGANETLIYSANDLKLVASKSAKGHTFANETVKLCNDIDLGATASTFAMRAVPEKNWTPLANFAGTFDGQGHTVYNLVSIEETKAGLFANLANGTVKNVTVENAYVSATSYAGGIVGHGYTGSIENCHVKGLVQISANYMVGGINGQGYAKISDCTVIGEDGSFVTGVFLETDLEGDNVGGIAGHIAENNTVSNCIVKNVAVSGTRKVGGIVGIANGGCVISNATVERVTVQSNADDAYLADNAAKIFVGGVLGEYNGNVTVSGEVKETSIQGLEEKTGVSAGGSRESTAKLTSSVKIGDNTKVNNGSYNYNDDKMMLYTEGSEVTLYSVKDYVPTSDTFVVPEGVTNVNASMASINPKKVVFASTVKNVGRVFDECHELVEVELNEGLEVIGNRAFRRCYDLVNITLPSTLTSIESGAFQSCTSLKSVIIPEGVTEIGDQAFGDCTSLETLVIPEGVTTIQGSMLRGSKVTEITIPSTVTYIGSMAFRDNYYLTTIHVKCATVPTIGASAFLRASEATEAGPYRLRTYYIYNQEVFDALSYNMPGEFNNNPKYAEFVSKAPIPVDVWDGTLDTTWYDGTQTSYKLTTAEQLAGFASLVNAGNDFTGVTVKLNAHIDLDNIAWTPIATGARSSGAIASGSKVFAGTFDGNGLNVSNLKLAAASESDAVGLFGIVTGTVANVNVVSSTVETASGNAGLIAGLVVGGKIENCTTAADCSITAVDGVGGIVGRMLVDGDIIDCVNNATVTGTAVNKAGVGGIVGKAYYTKVGKEMNIVGCVNNGNVNGWYVGGISGLSTYNITNCVNNGNINGGIVGGITGEQNHYGTVSGCENNGEVISTSNVAGGIVGWVRASGVSADYELSNEMTVTGNVNNGKVSVNLLDANGGLGGIVGKISNLNKAILTNNENKCVDISYVTTNITDERTMGGVVGGIEHLETVTMSGNTSVELA